MIVGNGVSAGRDDSSNLRGLRLAGPLRRPSAAAGEHERPGAHRPWSAELIREGFAKLP